MENPEVPSQRSLVEAAEKNEKLMQLSSDST
jgi:hypothetical protein